MQEPISSVNNDGTVTLERWRTFRIKNKFHSKHNKLIKKDERNCFVSKSFIELAKMLSKAANEGNIKEVKKLVSNGAPIQSIGTIGLNPLHLAAMNGHLEVCQYLKKFGIIINCFNKVNKTPLHLASVNGHLEVVNFLLNSGAIVDAYDMLHMTPLHWACDRGYKPIVEILLQYGADPNCCNKFGKSPLDLAKENNFFDIINAIQKYSAKNVDLESRDKQIELDGDGYITEDSEHSNSTNLSENEHTNDMLSAEITNNIIDDKEKDKVEIIINSEEMEEGAEEKEEMFIEEKEEDVDEEDSDISIECMQDNEEERMQDSLLTSLQELEEAVFNRKSYKLENVCINEATEILKAQAALVSLQDPSSLLRRAIAYGHTIQLTEAGQKALAMIKPEQIIPSQCREEESEDDKDESRRSPSQVVSVASTSNTCNALVLHQNPSGIPGSLQWRMENLQESLSTEIVNDLQSLTNLHDYHMDSPLRCEDDMDISLSYEDPMESNNGFKSLASKLFSNSKCSNPNLIKGNSTMRK